MTVFVFRPPGLVPVPDFNFLHYFVLPREYAYRGLKIIIVIEFLQRPAVVNLEALFCDPSLRKSGALTSETQH